MKKQIRSRFIDQIEKSLSDRVYSQLSSSTLSCILGRIIDWSASPPQSEVIMSIKYRKERT